MPSNYYILSVFLVVLVVSPSSSFLVTGESRTVKPFSFPFVWDEWPWRFSQRNMTIIVPPALSSESGFYVFDQHSPYQSSHRVFSVANDLASSDLEVDYLCVHPSKSSLYVLSNDSIFFLLLNGTATLVYHDPLLSLVSEQQNLFTGLHCLENGAILVLSESIVMHISFPTWPSANVTLFNQSIPHDEDDWFAWKLTADESRLITLVKRETAVETALFLYDLQSLALVERSLELDALTACLFLMDDGITFGAVIESITLKSKQSACFFEIMLIDSQNITNTTRYPLSQENRVPDTCQPEYAGVFSCMQFPELHTTMLYISLDYKYSPEVYTYYTFTSTSPSLFNSSILETNLTLDFYDAQDEESLLIQWLSPERVQVLAAEEDAFGSISVHLFEYTVSSQGPGVPSNFVRTNDYVILPSPYSFTASISTGSDMAYALSIQQLEFSAQNLSYNIDVLLLNLSRSYTAVTPPLGATLRLTMCDCFYDISLSPPSYVILFELQTDGTLVVWTACFEVFVFDANTLQLLEYRVMEFYTYDCKPSPGATDRNGTMYLLDENFFLPTIQTFSLDVYRYRSNVSQPQEILIFNGTALEHHIPNTFTAAVVSDSVFVLAANLAAQFNATTLSDLQVVSQPEWAVDQQLSVAVVTPNGSFIYVVGVSCNASESSLSLLEMVVPVSAGAAALNTTKYSPEILSDIPRMPGSITIVFSVRDPSVAYMLLGTGVLQLIDATQLRLGADRITIPVPPSSNVSFCGILEDSIGALHILKDDSLYLVYPNCPIGFSRDVSVSGQCQKCPNGSLTDITHQSCVACPPRTEANLQANLCLCATTYWATPGSSDCEPCPIGAQCTGNNTIEALPGYWESERNASQFYRCPFFEGCAADGCARGYTGVVCGYCEKGYGRVPEGCARCARHEWLYSTIVFAALIVALFLVLTLLWFDTRGENERFFGIVKTVVSFVQVLGYPSNGTPLFPNRNLQMVYVKFLSLLNAAGLRVFSFVSLDCLLGRPMQSYYFELLAFGFAPLVVAAMLFGLCYLCTSPLSSAGSEIASKRDDEEEEELLSPSSERRSAVRDSKFSAPIRLVLFLYLLLYPYITILLVQFFECQNIDGVFYLMVDYTSRCFDSTWKRMLSVEIVLVIIYPIGGPIAILFLLWRKRSSINLQFLTSQYHPKYYYWDIVELARKFSLLAATIWDQYEQQSHAQWYSGLPLFLSIVSLVLFAWIRPHRDPLDRYIHAASLAGVSLTYALPFVLPSSHSTYRLVVSWIVIVYLIAFTLLSSACAVWSARHQILRMLQSIFGPFLSLRGKNASALRNESPASDNDAGDRVALLSDT